MLQSCNDLIICIARSALDFPNQDSMKYSRSPPLDSATAIDSPILHQVTLSLAAATLRSRVPTFIHRIMKNRRLRTALKRLLLRVHRCGIRLGVYIVPVTYYAPNADIIELDSKGAVRKLH